MTKKLLSFTLLFLVVYTTNAQFATPFSSADITYYQNGTVANVDVPSTPFANDGIVFFSGDNATLTVTSSDFDQLDNMNLNYFNGVEWTLSEGGTVSFDWSYDSDDDPGYDGLYVLVGEAGNSFANNNLGNQSDQWTMLSDTSGESGTWSQELYAGQTLAISAFTEDAEFGPGMGTVTNFSFTPETAGMDDFAASSVKYYPNPIVDVLNISSGQSSISKVEMYNMLGQMVLSKSINGSLTSLNVSELDGGIYNVKIYSENKEQTIKVVKN